MQGGNRVHPTIHGQCLNLMAWGQNSKKASCFQLALSQAHINNSGLRELKVTATGRLLPGDLTTPRSDHLRLLPPGPDLVRQASAAQDPTVNATRLPSPRTEMRPAFQGHKSATRKHRPLTTRVSDQTISGCGLQKKAEREGFEPSRLLHLHDFQSCALGQTMRPLQKQIIKEHEQLTLNPDQLLVDYWRGGWGFEPTVDRSPQRFSRPPQSSTLAPPQKS